MYLYLSLNERAVVKRVEINEKVGVSADFVTILEQCMGYRCGV